ncbi:HdeD family acid-resistance protein [Chitinophagaceae bacterium LWZ2-11]
MKEVTRSIKNWWLLVLFGAIFIITGISMLFSLGASYITLAVLFSVLVLANGIASLIFAVTNWDHLEGRGWYVASAVVELFIGIILVGYPGITIITLPFIVGFWFILRSVFIISTAFELRSHGVRDWGWLLLGGITLLIFAGCVIFNPIVGAAYLVLVTAMAILLIGIVSAVFGFKLRKIKSATLDKIKEYRDAIRKGTHEFKL